MKIVKWVLVVLLFILVAFFTLGLVRPTVQYESKILVDKPVDRSFMVFLDVSKMGEWLTGFKKIEIVKGMPNIPGSIFNLTMEINGKEITVTEEVTDFRWYDRFSFTLEHDLMSVKCENVFAAQDMKTEITCTYTVTGKNLFWRSLDVLLKGKMEKQAQDDFDKLKKVIESI